MSDDIVTRLREYNPIKGFIDWHDTMTTAADEIEQLHAYRRKSLSALKAWDNFYTDMEADRDRWRNIAMFNLTATYGDQAQHHIDTCYAADGTYHGGADGDR
jgi:hypothetical protein